MDDLMFDAERARTAAAAHPGDPLDVTARFGELVQSPLRAGLVRHLHEHPHESYFVDTLMTIEQLAHFIDQHPNLPEKNKLTYSLGLRYLRANRWNVSERASVVMTYPSASDALALR